MDLDLETPPKTAPRVVVVEHDDGTLDCAYLLADTMNISLGKKPLRDILYLLLAAYYAWDLNYPKQYQILAFLQVYLIEDTKNAVYKSTALPNLITSFWKTNYKCSKNLFSSLVISNKL